MMRWHRLCVIIGAVLIAYVFVTGAGTQFFDLRALVTHAPETDPDMLMMRQHIYGPPNYSVVSAPDYTAPALPSTLDYAAGLARAAALGHAAMPSQPLRLVELRSAEGKVAAHVQVGSKHLIFDLATGAPLPASVLPPPQPGRDFVAPRATFKYFHRFNYLGGFGPGITGLAGVALAALMLTGLVHYARIYRVRASKGRSQPFWKGGDWWRQLHRWIAVGASVIILWIVVTGLTLAVDNIGAAIHSIGLPRAPGAFDGDQSSPMADGEIASDARTTLAAFESKVPGTGIKVLRLRHFVGYHQGVVVAADGDTSQYVFNAVSGQPMSMSEKGYPDLSFPSGWDWHQRLKRLHRGDFFGLTGRWLDFLGGLSVLYLLTSGCFMYWQLWTRRRRAGRKSILWS